MRYAVAACQTDFPCPVDRSEIASRVDRMLTMIDGAVVGYRPFFPVRLVVFPEFAHAAPIYATVSELRDRLAVPIPNEHTDRYLAKAKEHGVYIQTGTFIELDPAWPGVLFNTTCLGCAICYDWIFPEAIRQLAFSGAEVLIRVSAYMDPWGATPPMDWWTVVNRCRALENLAYVVAANQGASLRNYGPFSWPGGSMVVDYDGRILAQADPGPGEKIVVAEIDLGALREARSRRLGHNPLAHLRREAYRGATAGYPPESFSSARDPKGDRTTQENEAAIRRALRRGSLRNGEQGFRSDQRKARNPER